MPLLSSVILQVKDTDINDSMHYLYFRCVCVGGGEVKSISVLHDAQLGVTVPYLQRSKRNLVPGGRNTVLNWVLKLNYLSKFFEVLNLVFACICNEKD